MKTSNFPATAGLRNAASEQVDRVVSVPPSEDYPSPDASHVQLSSREVAVASGGLVLLISLWHFGRQYHRHRKAEAAGTQARDRPIPVVSRATYDLPCTRCHYFNRNTHLPCAVNPRVALKPNAHDCTEFLANNHSQPTQESR